MWMPQNGNIQTAWFQSKKRDQIKPIVLKNLTDEVIMIFLWLFGNMIAQSYPPSEWRDSSVIFIGKPGKKRYDLPKSLL